jgi:inhibitor of KinA
MDRAFRFQPYGDCALLATVAEEISEDNYGRVRGFVDLLEEKKIISVKELVPSYRSLLVVYDPLESDYASLENRLRSYAELAGYAGNSIEETVDLPVCYDPVYGFDLDDVARHTGLDTEEVVRLHSGSRYRIYMLGFLPGFPYLGGMSERIAMPRRANPRTRIPSGSVGIADRQTGVYPLDSPGGWNIIGRTPARLFDPGRKEPALLRSGQFIRFTPTSMSEFEEILAAQREGRWMPAVHRSDRDSGPPAEGAS